MTIVFVAGATGNLGGRVVRELVRTGATVRALARPAGATRPEADGVEVVQAELGNLAALKRAVQGASTVVSTLQGLEPVIIDGQTNLLRAAEDAGVGKFIPSDFALDFFKTPRGSNRNFDLRRRFDERLDQAAIRATSILNGAFMDLLDRGAGDRLLDHKRGRVTFFGYPDQPLDFTSMDDVAAFTARAALDDAAPRILRISGDRLTPSDLAAAAQDALERPFALHRAGGLGLLRMMIPVAKVVAPGRGKDMPAWQGMQYAENMFGGRGLLSPLDNDRYAGLTWTRVREFLASSRS